MTKTIFTLIAAASLVATSNAQIIITEVMSNSDNPGGAGNGDWFELYNAGPISVDLTGWSWDDTPDQTNAPTLFGSISLNAGAYLIVVDENSGNTEQWIDDVWGVRDLVDAGGLTVLNNSAWGPGLGASGDSVYIFNENDVIVTSVTFGDSDGGGKTFSWDRTGTFLGFSTAGVDGAFLSIGDGAGGAPGIDVGSPGFAAVPEPGTYALMIGGLLAIFVFSRRRRAC